MRDAVQASFASQLMYYEERLQACECRFVLVKLRDAFTSLGRQGINLVERASLRASSDSSASRSSAHINANADSTSSTSITSSSSYGGGGGVDIPTELADKVYSLWGSSVRDQFASDNAHLTGASDAKQNPSAFGILARSVTESSQHNRELLSKFDLLERKFEVTQAALLRSLHSPNIRTKTTRRALSITSFHIRR